MNNRYKDRPMPPLMASLTECARVLKLIHKECEAGRYEAGRYSIRIPAGKDHGFIEPTARDMEVAKMWLPVVTELFHESNTIYAKRHGKSLSELHDVLLMLRFCLLKTTTRLKSLRELPLPPNPYSSLEKLSLELALVPTGQY